MEGKRPVKNGKGFKALDGEPGAAGAEITGLGLIFSQHIFISFANDENCLNEY